MLGWTVDQAFTTIEGALDALVELDPRVLSPDELTGLEARVSVARSRLDELAARAVPAVEALEVPREAGCVSTTAWIAFVTGTSRAMASKTVKAAEQITGLDATRHAWASGGLSTEKALVIGAAIDRLPVWASGSDELEDAEATLLEYAPRFGLADFKRIANRLVEVIGPGWVR